MGVDAHLYVPQSVPLEAVAYSLALAMGNQPELIEGKPNLYHAEKFLESAHFGLTMWTGKFEKVAGAPHCFPNVHSLNSTENFPWAAWLVSAKSRAEVIAIFRTVAQQLGGFVEWQDCTSEGIYFCGPDEKTWSGYTDAAYETETAVILPEDHKHEAYNTKNNPLHQG